jgi:hypothetical protein
MRSVEVSRDCEPGPGAGMQDETEDFGVLSRGSAALFFGDFGKQAVLDGIPFGSAGGKMSNGHGEPNSVAELGSCETPTKTEPRLASRS